jgi:CheY-like chemotaxis protein
MAETVLVVDDEEAVRRMVERILARAGYRVLTAANAAEAIELARSHAGPVHCLITDLAMPGLPGSELTRRLSAERRELAALYMSGYAEPDLHHVGNADNRTNLLPKPFTRVDLLAAVRATIGEHRAHPR